MHVVLSHPPLLESDPKSSQEAQAHTREEEETEQGCDCWGIGVIRSCKVPGEGAGRSGKGANESGRRESAYQKLSGK